MTMTVTPADFNVLTCQAGLFTPTGKVSMRAFVNELLPKWKEAFDGEPKFFPTEGLPPDVPFVKLETESHQWKCDLSNRRADVYWHKTEQESSVDLAEFFDRSTELLLMYRSVCNRQVGRLAAVVKRYAAVEQPGLFLARHFCQERWDEAPLNQPEEFQLHAHKRFQLGDFRVNSWVRNKAATLSVAEQKDQPIVLVEQDINTVAEDPEKMTFSDDQCRAFFSRASEEHQHILRLYYPPNG